MKKLFLIPVLGLLVTACNFASDEDYKELAQDTCDCVNKTTENISDRAMKIIIDSGGDEIKIEEGMTEYVADDPSAAMADGMALQQFATEFPDCMAALEKKYDHLYSSESDKEVQEKLITTLRGLDGCSKAADLMEVGIAAQ